jgi:hypothetical protein
MSLLSHQESGKENVSRSNTADFRNTCILVLSGVHLAVATGFFCLGWLLQVQGLRYEEHWHIQGCNQKNGLLLSYLALRYQSGLPLVNTLAPLLG